IAESVRPTLGMNDSGSRPKSRTGTAAVIGAVAPEGPLCGRAAGKDTSTIASARNSMGREGDAAPRERGNDDSIETSLSPAPATTPRRASCQPQICPGLYRNLWPRRGVPQVYHDAEMEAITVHSHMETATFDKRGVLWFTGQNGIYGRLDPAVGRVEAFDAPHGQGPYGITTTPDGTVYYAALAGSHIARINTENSAATAIDPPTPQQGARRVWSDSHGRIWVSEWNAGQVAMYDPAIDRWREWRLPGDHPQPYAVYVDDHDIVWLSDFGANALVRFDPTREAFQVFPLPSSPANVRQILGRQGEVWGAESGVDKLVVL